MGGANRFMIEISILNSDRAMTDEVQKSRSTKTMMIRRLRSSERLIALLLSAMRFVNSRDCSNESAVAVYEEEMRALLEFLEFIALNRGKLGTKALLSAKG